LSFFPCIYNFISFHTDLPFWCYSIHSSFPALFCIILLSQWFNTFFQCTNKWFVYLHWRSIILRYATRFLIHLASRFLSLERVFRTVIDYVTVYRAHSLQSIRKKGVTPLSVPSLSMHHYSIYSGNSVSGRYPPPLLSVGFKISAAGLYTKLAQRFNALAFCASFSAKCNFNDAAPFVSVARTRIVFVSSFFEYI